ncbi:TAXI family TRAP transporter solute-binding subunit [Brevibacterium otitidis]|uniref:TAXI family TRAP transporter solute-binding subunit n=1 Tax=Brevibacterium otitidis TaxID=53364 RepID=A0ABV5X3W4_9MICO|nr:TAXI family TRAP transporter solute-binding subunit [Brevibacterium otitidis]
MKIGLVGRAAAIMSAAALVLSACGGGNGGGGGAPAEDFTQDLTFATGGTAGVYYPLGNEYSRIFQDAVEGLTVNAVETDGSTDNLGRIAKGEAQLAFTQNNTANDAVTGTGEFEELGQPLENVGWIGQLYPEAAQIITLADSGFESVEDLKGKKIAVGAPGSGTAAVAKLILEAYGFEEGDYEPFEESFADARSKLQDGNIDASIEVLGVPAASLSELAANADVKLLPLDEDKAEQIAGESDYESYVIPGGSYDFAPDDVQTVTVFASIVASTNQVSEEDAYGITKAMYEQAGDISLAQSDLINVDDALLGQGDVPLHPGAKKYFDEVGVSAE